MQLWTHWRNWGFATIQEIGVDCIAGVPKQHGTNEWIKPEEVRA